MQLPVTDVQNEPMGTPFADVSSVLSQVRCFAHATRLSQRLPRRRSERSPRSLQFARQPSDGFFLQWVVHISIHESLRSILVCCETHNVLCGGRAADKVAPNDSVARTIVAAKPSLAQCTTHLFRASRRRLCSTETEASWKP